jgi:hypothetical protein
MQGSICVDTTHPFGHHLSERTQPICTETTRPCKHNPCPCRQPSPSEWTTSPHPCKQPFLSSSTPIVSMRMRELLSGHPMSHPSPNFQTPSCPHLLIIYLQIGGCVHMDGRGGLGHEVRSLKLRRVEGTWAHPWGWR